MSAEAQPAAAVPPVPQGLPQGLPQGKAQLCPYCGHAQFAHDRCHQCGGFFDPLSLQATQVAMGPWYVRDPQQPFRPGCSYDTLKKMVARGMLTEKSVIRGPSTQQFWSMAKFTPGVAHLIGFCHACQAPTAADAMQCGQCGAPFPEITARNEMGLHYRTQAEANQVQRGIEAALARKARGESVSEVVAQMPTFPAAPTFPSAPEGQAAHEPPLETAWTPSGSFRDNDSLEDLATLNESKPPADWEAAVQEAAPAALRLPPRRMSRWVWALLVVNLLVGALLACYLLRIIG